MVYRMAGKRNRTTEVEVIKKDGEVLGEVTMEYIPPTKKNKKQAVVEPNEPKINYCDLHMVCQKCKLDRTIGKGIEGGLQLIIVPQEESFIELSCSKCDTSIRLLLTLGEAPVTPDFEIVDTTDEDVSQENKSKESL
jgi:hypothetical protein